MCKCNIHLSVILPHVPLSLRFPQQKEFLLSPIRATCLAHPVLLAVITLTHNTHFIRQLSQINPQFFPLRPQVPSAPHSEHPQPRFFTAVTRSSLFHSHIAHIFTDSVPNSNVILTLVTLDPLSQAADCHDSDISCNPKVITLLPKYLHLAD